jgi:hypothetical protein
VAATLQARLDAQASVSPADLRTLLIDLASDGVLEKAGDRWRFRSGLVRRYWKEYEV